jgi:hypothetical protein
LKILKDFQAKNKVFRFCGSPQKLTPEMIFARKASYRAMRGYLKTLKCF